MMRPAVLAVVLLFYASCVSAQQLRPLPPLRTLSDEVGVFSVEEGRALSRSAEETFDRTDVRVIVVITQTTKPEEIEDSAEGFRQARRRP